MLQSQLLPFLARYWGYLKVPLICLTTSIFVFFHRDYGTINSFVLCFRRQRPQYNEEIWTRLAVPSTLIRYENGTSVSKRLFKSEEFVDAGFSFSCSCDFPVRFFGKYISKITADCCISKFFKDYVDVEHLRETFVFKFLRCRVDRTLLIRMQKLECFQICKGRDSA